MLSDYLSMIDQDSIISDFKFEDSATSYDFPNEDFCLFKYFPRRRIFTTSISYHSYDTFEKIQTSNKSITIKFLRRNSIIVEQFLEKKSDNRFIICNVTQKDDQLIEQMLTRCFNMSSEVFGKSYEDKLYFNSRDVTYVLKWLEFTGPIITLPIVAACAFILNFLVILVITNKKNKEEKLFETRMFDYIMLNSVFVCLECFICEFKLLNYCLGVNSLYCSSVKYFSLLNVLGRVTGYIGETMKTCAIGTGLLFSIQRYIEATKTENRHLKRLSQIKFRRIVLALVAFSALISCSKVFEYDNYLIFQNDFDSPSPFDLSLSRFYRTKAESVFYLTHYVLTDFTLLLLNLFVDLVLVIHVKKDLKAKIKNKSKTVDQSSSLKKHKADRGTQKEEKRGE